MLKMQLTEGMKTVIEELYETVNMNYETCCEQCPYAEQCGQYELFWSCSIWEDSMGEDL